MASFNKIIIMGNLTRDPQLSYLPSQTPVVEFGLAANHKYKGSDGQMREDVCFVDCRCYGPRAETISKYCQKGRPLMVEGRLQFDQWEAQDGSKRSKHRIFVENFTFVDSRGGGSTGGGGESPAGPPTGENNYSADNDMPAPPGDDIPF
jgi:single-strand DNA-binding protein